LRSMRKDVSGRWENLIRLKAEKEIAVRIVQLGERKVPLESESAKKNWRRAMEEEKNLKERRPLGGQTVPTGRSAGKRNGRRTPLYKGKAGGRGGGRWQGNSCRDRYLLLGGAILTEYA